MKRLPLLLSLAGLVAAPAMAEGLSAAQTETMKKLIATYAEQAKEQAAKANKGRPAPVEAFSAESGRQIYLKHQTWEDNTVPACSSCHTEDPKNEGKHALSKKPIKPLAPAANPERFTNAEKVEHNFSKHCRELFSRDCSASEKGHFLTYLMSVK